MKPKPYFFDIIFNGYEVQVITTVVGSLFLPGIIPAAVGSYPYFL
jgi:hypothetical protein